VFNQRRLTKSRLQETQLLETSINPKNARVLLVEDSPNDREIATRAIKAFGIRHCSVAKSAEEALNEVFRHQFDVVLVDYQLPGMNGLQFVEHLRELSPNTRVIIVTGARQEKVAVAAMKLGASDYISKDEYLTSGIVRALQAALRSRASAGQIEQREVLSAATERFHQSTVEASWLIQALDERHGYQPADAVMETVGQDWLEPVKAFTSYLNASFLSFPNPATEEEDALIRTLRQAGASPRDVIRVYADAVRDVSREQETDEDATPLRPLLLLAHILACLIEEHQLMLMTSAAAQKQPEPAWVDEESPLAS
jgi:CheY-like chemotaxis protein